MSAIAMNKTAVTRRAKLDPLVAQMYALYQEGMSLSEVGRRFRRDRRGVQELFAKRGLVMRAHTNATKPRQSGGQFMPLVPLTPAQIDELVAQATRIWCPPVLKTEWRRWSLARRGEFIARIRAKLARPGDRPELPFSSNVEPFDYASERAHAIAAKLNAGLDSRSAGTKIKLSSQGVIWREQLWFWVHNTGYVQGPYTEERGRPMLHREIYAEHYGALPPGAVIRFADGNPNNLDPANLVLATRNDLARENQAKGLTKKSRAFTALLLDRAQNESNEHLDQFNQLSKRRAV